MSKISKKELVAMMALFEEKLKGHNVSMRQDVGFSTIIAACEAMEEWVENKNKATSGTGN